MTATFTFGHFRGPPAITDTKIHTFSNMMRRLTYEYRIYPSKKQVQRLQRSFLLAQRMYNHLLERTILTYQIEGRRLTKFDMCNVVKEVKDDDSSFRSAYSQVLQNCVDRLSKAFDNFFRRVKESKEVKRQKPGFPRFKTSMKSINRASSHAF